MKVTELMIGNWVYLPGMTTDKEYPAKLDENFIYDAKYAEPIPITPEILEKNGFKNQHTIGELYRCDIRLDDKIGGEYITLNYYMYNKELSIKLVKDYSTCPSISKLPIKYVHELQNVLTLCKIKKDIEL